MEEYTIDDIPVLLQENLDAVVIVDSENNQYKSIIRKGIFTSFLGETGSYHDLIEKLWFHFSDSNEKITKDYHVFVSSYGEFKGKYSRRLKIMVEGRLQPNLIQQPVSYLVFSQKANDVK